MGVSIKVHIGPFLEVKGMVKKKYTDHIRTCINENCVYFHKKLEGIDNYCSKCGYSICENREIVSIFEHNANSLLMEYQEEHQCWDNLFHIDFYGEDKEQSIFLSNIKIPGVKNHFKEDEITEIKSINTSVEIEAFEKKFKKEIDYLIENFGKKNVKVKWGSFQWYS